MEPNRENLENHPQRPQNNDDGAPSRSLIAAYVGQTPDDLPIGGYAVLITAFVSSFSALVIAAKRANQLPARVEPVDIALLGIATHKLTRIVSRERIAIPLRAPFTRYEGRDGAGLVKEEPRGRALQRAIGSLLVCQFCVGPWVASALAAGLVFAPRPTRLVSSVFAMVAISDFLHQAYAGARRWSAPAPPAAGNEPPRS
jgi:hypothetical protein